MPPAEPAKPAPSAPSPSAPPPPPAASDKSADPKLAAAVAAATGLPAPRVAAVLRLLSEGATVPFIARYRKEATGSMDETAIRAVQERGEYLSALSARKAAVLEGIAEQGKLTAELRARIEAAATLQAVEDLYLPYRPKRRTRGQMARERGLEPLAARLRAQEGSPRSLEEWAAAYVSAEKGVATPADALAGASDIIAEDLSDDADLRARLREYVARSARYTAKVTKEFAGPGQKTKFETYYGYDRPVKDAPSHAVLALHRGQREGVLAVKIAVDEVPAVGMIADRLVKRRGTVFEPFLTAAAADAWDRLLEPSLAGEVDAAAKERADAEAIRTFGTNLRHLLLSAPAGEKVVLGIDPGFRTGCKIVVIDRTGRLLDHVTIYPTEPRKDVEGSAAAVLKLIERHGVELIAVGNGTGGRETEAFVAETLKRLPEGRRPAKVTVNEAGASVYSASETAAAEFPDLDVTVRGAVSIARRLQDPLAELVKIEPKSIGVGQYQHDVDQKALGRELEAVVESAVNGVGVDLNTASAGLLAFVSGVNAALARNIVAHRDKAGPFRRRRDLLEVPRFGPKAFEQAAGFLRIRGAAHPLDGSAVHPERYALVERMAADLGLPLAKLVGDPAAADRIDVKRYVGGDVGPETLADIIAELKKPGRDPRSEFRTAGFAEGVNDIKDLAVGMELEGVVTNVAAFGAFVDIGVHQDGLVHVSELDWRFVKDPAEVVRVGQIVKVKVLSVDPQLKRIGLSIKQTRPPPQPSGPARPPAAAGPGLAKPSTGPAKPSRPGGLGPRR
jgi:uncharacterized protein